MIMARRGARGAQRYAGLDDVYERDDAAREERLEARLTQRIDEQFRALREQLAAIMGVNAPPQNRPPIPRPVEEEEGSDVGEEYDNLFAGDVEPRRGVPVVRAAESSRWESGFKLNIPEFKGALQPDEFLDWVASVEEVLDFKDVSLDKRVPLVATKLRGRAAAWWQPPKQSRIRQGKQKISTWEKLLKYMRQEFLPYNYTRTVYQQFQNLRQGNRSVDEYTTDFYQLKNRIDLGESESHTVSRYIGGLKQALQDAINFYDPFTVSEAHQKALMLEKQSRRTRGTMNS